MITKQQFLLWQPSAPEETETDSYYLALANRLAAIASERGLFPDFSVKAVERAALFLIGYYQDVICDSGVWRSFIDECRKMYGKTLPFYSESEEYTDYELNKNDVRFMTWYSLAMNSEDRRMLYPKDAELIDGADIWWEELEKVYDESPIPVDYRMVHELEMHAEEDGEAILKLGNWLFLHCYLMAPAFALTLTEIASQFNLNEPDGLASFQDKLEIAMGEMPTGPLSLSLRDWLYLIVEGKIPVEKSKADLPDHKYYTAFMKATGGKRIKFFGNYDDLNRFFIEALGWEAGEEHLAQLKNEHDFILLVDRAKGMLLAKNIARCIKAPMNPYYDEDYARRHAIELLTVRGCCPGDLLHYSCKEGWLPDAVFPGTDDHGLVADNWDFIARCYLQQYYTGD